MYYLTTDLKSCNIRTADGEELGTVKDFYFDEKFWAIRYFVVDTMKWLPGKKVVLSPITVDSINLNKEFIDLTESAEKVKNAPIKNEHTQISKHNEEELANYYGWPNYWTGVGPWGGFSTPSELTVAHREEKLQRGVQADGDDLHQLRSVNDVKGELTGFNVEGTDEKIGNVSDFVIDQKTWQIKYFVVDTSKILAGDLVLLAKDWITEINWHDKKFFVNVTKELAEKAANFDSSTEITSEYEDNLYSNFGKSK